MLPSSDTQPGPPRGGGSARARCPALGGQRWGRAPTREPAVSRCPQNRPHPAAMLMFGGTCFPHLAPVPPKCPCGLWELAAHTRRRAPNPFIHHFSTARWFSRYPHRARRHHPPGQPRTDVCGPRQLAVPAQMCRAQYSCAKRCVPAPVLLGADVQQRLAHTQRSAGTGATPRATPSRDTSSALHTYVQSRARTCAHTPSPPPPRLPRRRGQTEEAWPSIGGVTNDGRRGQ